MNALNLHTIYICLFKSEKNNINLDSVVFQNTLLLFVILLNLKGTS